MSSNYTARYTKIPSGYMGQIVEWPEVVTEGETIETCRELLKDALREMIAAYREQGDPSRRRTLRTGCRRGLTYPSVAAI
jgi:predicted RNase H-like HicB family nuclease